MRSFAAQMLAVALLGTGAASAQTPTAGLALRWRAPRECPSGEEVSAAVTRLLGRPIDALTPRRVAVARVRRGGRRGWRLQVTVTTGATRRHRSLAGDSCASVADAAALVLALAIDPDAVASHAPPPSDSPPPEVAVPTEPVVPTRTPEPPRLVVPTPSPPPPPRRPGPALIRGLARISALGDLGSQPSLTWGATLVLGLSVGAFRAELSASYFGPQRAELGPGDPSQGGEISLFAVALRGCLAAPMGPVDLGGCAGAEIGVQSGAAFGVSRPGSGDALWVAVPLVATLRWRLSRRLGLHLEAGAAIPVLRRQFAIENLGAVFRPSPAALRGAFGAEVYF